MNSCHVSGLMLCATASSGKVGGDTPDSSEANGSANDAGRDLAAEDLAAALDDVTISGLGQPQPKSNPQLEPPVSTARLKVTSKQWSSTVLSALQKKPTFIQTSNIRISAIACVLDGDEAIIFCALWSGALKIFSANTRTKVTPIPHAGLVFETDQCHFHQVVRLMIGRPV